MILTKKHFFRKIKQHRLPIGFLLHYKHVVFKTSFLHNKFLNHFTKRGRRLNTINTLNRILEKCCLDGFSSNFVFQRLALLAYSPFKLEKRRFGSRIFDVPYCPGEYHAVHSAVHRVYKGVQQQKFFPLFRRLDEELFSLIDYQGNAIRSTTKLHFIGFLNRSRIRRRKFKFYRRQWLGKKMRRRIRKIVKYRTRRRRKLKKIFHKKERRKFIHFAWCGRHWRIKRFKNTDFPHNWIWPYKTNPFQEWKREIVILHSWFRIVALVPYLVDKKLIFANCLKKCVLSFLTKLLSLTSCLLLNFVQSLLIIFLRYEHHSKRIVSIRNASAFHRSLTYLFECGNLIVSNGAFNFIRRHQKRLYILWRLLPTYKSFQKPLNPFRSSYFHSRLEFLELYRYRCRSYSLNPKYYLFKRFVFLWKVGEMRAHRVLKTRKYFSKRKTFYNFLIANEKLFKRYKFRKSQYKLALKDYANLQ